jgi:hypothetical protein
MSLTNFELQEIGITRELYDRWYQITNYLFNVCLKAYPGKVDAVENEIIISISQNIVWKISATMVNKKFVDVDLIKGQIEYLRLFYTGNYQLVAGIILNIITEESK